MAADGSELLALVLELQADGAGDEQAVASLVDRAQGSATTLMTACAYALSLARDMPFDPASERTLKLLTLALQRAVQVSDDVHSEDRVTLLRQIVEYSGGASMGPDAVASRTEELDADLEKLRPTGDSEAPTSS